MFAKKGKPRLSKPENTQCHVSVRSAEDAGSEDLVSKYGDSGESETQSLSSAVSSVLSLT